MTTSTDPETLRALIERCEKAEGPDRELDAAIEVAILFKGNCGYQQSRGSFYATDRRVVSVHDAPEYTASLDAAMTLVPEDDQKCWAAGWGIDGAAFATVGFDRSRRAATPALALCAAALRAHLQGNPHDD